VTRPARIVDAHVHFWDPARTDWYPYLGGGQELGMGDVRGMARRFDADVYRSESAAWNVEKFVNVAAATGVNSVDETIELDGRAEATGHPDAIIGGLPPGETTAEAMAYLDRQLSAARFRGVRPMSPRGPVVPADDVLTGVAERGLLFELMARTDGLVDAAERLERHPDLTVVVEHTGWPRSADADEFAAWSAGIDALAAVGERVHCKLSGLAMPLGAMSATAFRPWVEHAIGAFGVARCCFGSNFPVDGLHGALDALWSAYAEVTSGLDAADIDALFATNAEALYGC